MRRGLFGLLIAAAATAILQPPSAAVAQEAVIRLDTINAPLVPTARDRGDREFGGNGPAIAITVTLTVENGGTEIFANVNMSAEETGGDRSTTSGSMRRSVWRAGQPDNFRVQSIVGPSGDRIAFVSASGASGVPFVAHGGGDANFDEAVYIRDVGNEDGGRIVRVGSTTPGSFIASIDVLGDTSGDDISDDANPHGDTSVRRIDFNDIRVTTSPL